MKIIDTHCHYNMEPLYSGQPLIFDLPENHPLRALSWQDHWRLAQEKGVAGAVIIGTELNTTDRAFTIAASDPNLLVSVGVHPIHAQEVTLEELTAAGETWQQQTFHAVGETGLDFYRLDETGEDFETLINHQKTVFRWHIRFAQKNEVPLILHVRDKTDRANWEALKILEQEYEGNKPFVLHCAAGPLEYIKKAISMGGYIGFDGNITYPNAQHIRDLVKSVPADRLLIETDAPFLTPQTHRGTPCEPWMIAETAEYVRKELGLDLQQIFANTQQFFRYSFEE